SGRLPGDRCVLPGTDVHRRLRPCRAHRQHPHRRRRLLDGGFRVRRRAQRRLRRERRAAHVLKENAKKSHALAAVVLVSAIATRAAAHSVPIDPSVNSCTITLSDPATGAPELTVAGAPPFRGTYDRTASTTVVCEADSTFPQTRCAAGVTARA